MFEKTRTVSQVIGFFTSTSKADDEVIRHTAKGLYADHQRIKGSSMPSVDKMAQRVLGNVLYTQDHLGLARVKPEFLPLAILAYADFARETENRPMWGQRPALTNSRLLAASGISESGMNGLAK